MKIKNLTPNTQKLVLREITGEKRVYDVFVAPYGTTDIERMTIKEPKNLSGIFEVEGMISPITNEVPTVEEDTESTAPDIQISVHDEDMSIDPAEEETTSSSHICDICGSEFGSARGLASHKNRAHPDN